MESTSSHNVHSLEREYILHTKSFRINGIRYAEYYKVFSRRSLDLHQRRDIVRHAIRNPYAPHSHYGMIRLNGKFPGDVSDIAKNYNLDVYPCLEIREHPL